MKIVSCINLTACRPVCLLACLLLFCPASIFLHRADAAVSSAAPVIFKDTETGKAWNIEADRLIFYHESNVIMGEGDVRIARDDMRVYADYIIYDRTNSTIWASGHVVMHVKNDVIRGAEAKLDISTRTGEIIDANLFLQRNNVYITADRIIKTGPEEYQASDATISTCALPDQAWRIRARDMKLTVNGNAIVKNTTFDVKDFPVFYTPWASVPLNKYRKTGFLIPGYSSSRRNGFGIYAPFFFVLNDSMDITYYPHYMTSRGFMQGLEYRHNFSDEDVAIFRYNFLSDQKSDNDYNNDGYARGNRFRWWIRGKMNQSLPWGFKAKLDLDMVSDRDYLQEFDVGDTSFASTNRLFQRYFHRSLAYRTDAIRPSIMQVTRNYQDTFLGGVTRYNDNHNTGDRKYTVQTLPSLLATGFKKRLFNTPLYYDYDVAFTNYWRESGTRESRFNMSPHVMMPVNVYDWLDVVLNAGFMNTSYWTGGKSETPDSANMNTSYRTGCKLETRHPADTANRFLYTLSADASKTFGRTFHGGSSDMLWHHTIRPRLLYELQPAVNQDDLPYIDRFDCVPKRSRLSVSLLTFLSSRSRTGRGRFSYRDMVRLDLVQRFNFIKEPLYNIPTLNDNNPQSMSEFYSELEIKPWDRFFMRYDSLYNHYGHAFSTHNVTANLSSAMGDRLNFYYRYNRLTDINQLGVDMTAVVLPSLLFFFNVNQDFAQASEIQSNYGLTYQGSCWTLSGLLSHNRDDTSISFNVGLRGIGSSSGMDETGGMGFLR